MNSSVSMRRRPKIYLETTLFNYYFDKDRDAHVDTVNLFKEIAAGKYEAYTSEAVIDELEDAPAKKRDAMLALVREYNITVLRITEEAEDLADIYAEEGIIPLKYMTDGIHIAVATVNDLDFIVSLNFRHIVNVKTERLTHMVNIRHGYRPIEIASPMEAMDENSEYDSRGN